MKRIPVLVMATAISAAVLFTGCGSNGNEIPADENASYEGTYIESTAGKGTITITKDGDLYMIAVEWKNGAAELDEWTFAGKFDDDAVLEYSNCLKVVTEFDENGGGDPKEAYSVGTGTLQYSDGSLVWIDDQENVADGCIFVKAEDEEER